MTLFCIVWMPFFSLFWLALTKNNYARSLAAIVWPLITGIIIALLRILWHPVVHSSGFGLSRLFSGFFDYVSLPPLLAILSCALLPLFFKSRQPFSDWTGFTLIALALPGVVYGLNWSENQHPLYLVLPILLWTIAALAANLIKAVGGKKGFLSKLCGGFLCAALLALNAACWWAFFCQKTLLGICLLIVGLIPALLGFKLVSKQQPLAILK